MYVKPVKAGSSFGITRVESPDQLSKAIDGAFLYDNQVILEENIQGIEVGCAVLGTETLLTGAIDEIEAFKGFLTLLKSTRYTPPPSMCLHASATPKPRKSSRRPNGFTARLAAQGLPGGFILNTVRTARIQ